MNIHDFLCILALLSFCGAAVLAIIMAIVDNKKTNNGIVSKGANNDDNDVTISDAIPHLKRCNSYKE